MNQSSKDFIIDAYFNQNKSTVWIGKQLGISPKTVRDAIIKSGFKLRAKKDAAETSYKNGRTNAMKGKTHSEESKKKIAKSVHKNWKELSEKDYEKRIEKCRENWYNLDVLARENIIYKSRLALSRAAREGSKLERQVAEFLLKNNLSPVLHYDKFPYERLEVDIFLPANKIAIEIDGPSHFLPIYGDERLQSTILSDQKKNNLILGLGYVVIRVGFIDDVSKYQAIEMMEELLTVINEIKENFPETGKRFIEMEIK